MSAELRPQVYLNGQFVPATEARISVLDRGFLFGDAVYEVIPVHAGLPFMLAAHLARLDHSLGEVGIANPHSGAHWQGLVGQLIERNGGGDLGVYIQVSRGAAATRSHSVPVDLTPTVVAFCQDLVPPDTALRERGVSALVRADERWHRCHIKSTSLLANVLLADQAAQVGANEVILHRDGLVTEGASSNVFIVLGERVLTPRVGPQILSGVTRAAVLQVLAERGIAGGEAEISVDDLRSAQEVWLSSSTREVLAVTSLDGQPVGNGMPGPLSRRVQQAIEALH